MRQDIVQEEIKAKICIAIYMFFSMKYRIWFQLHGKSHVFSLKFSRNPMFI